MSSIAEQIAKVRGEILEKHFAKQEEILTDLACAGIDPRIVRWYPPEAKLEGNHYVMSQSYDLLGKVE